MQLDEWFERAFHQRDRSVRSTLEAWLSRSAGSSPDTIAKACLGLARIYLLDRDFVRAGGLLDRGIAAASSDDITRLRLLNMRAYCFLELGCIAEAVEPLLVVERTGGAYPSEINQAKLNLALALLDLGDVAGAAASFEQLVGPEATTWHLGFRAYGLARCRLREGRVEAASAHLDELQRMEPKPPGIGGYERLVAALLAEQRDDWPRVRDEASRALTAFGTDSGVEALECRTLLARAARNRGELHAARAAVDEALRAAPPGRHRAPVLREKALLETACADPAAAAAAWDEAYQNLADADRGSAGRALRASSARATADVARVRELELSAVHEALQRAYRSVEEQVSDRTRDLEAEVEERRAAEGRALAANRAKNEFLAGMSHELRTPLNAIIGYTEMLIEGPTPDPDLARVLRSAMHLLSLVDDLLDLARVEAGRIEVAPRDLDLPALLTEIADRMAPHGQLARARFELRPPPPGTRFRTDPVRLSQILQNLISNADRHTAEGRVTLQAEVRGEVLRCEVADTGAGIPPEWLERVFEPFARGPGGGRAGLGLALVRHLADALGGTVQLRSEVGKGTTIVVSLHALGAGTKKNLT